MITIKDVLEDKKLKLAEKGLLCMLAFYGTINLEQLHKMCADAKVDTVINNLESKGYLEMDINNEKKL